MALVPIAAATALVVLSGHGWIAGGVGSVLGIALGRFWLRELPSSDARFATRIVLVGVLGLFAPSCAARTGPHLTVLARGVPRITLAEAQNDDREWVRIEEADVTVRTDLMGHSTFDHSSHGIRQTFVAPLVSEDWKVGTVAVWLGCQRSGKDVNGTRRACERELKKGPLLLRRAPREFVNAIENAVEVHDVKADDELREYRLSASPRADVAEDVVPLMVIVLIGGGFAVATTYRRRRAMQLSLI